MRCGLIIFPILCVILAYIFPQKSSFLLEKFINVLNGNQHFKQTSFYDPYYAMFVLQWPISVCIFEVIEKRRDRGYTANQENCRFPKQKQSWTIHGIWNSRSSGNRCSATPLKRSDVENITVELDNRWVQVRKYFDNFNFWEYEWNKHGTCLLEHSNFSEANKYFQQAIAWHRQFDPTSALIACGMPPNDKRMYNNVQMTNCLKNHLKINSQIILSTRRDNMYRHGTSLLREIRICFHRNLTLANCELSYPGSFDFVYPHTVEDK